MLLLAQRNDAHNPFSQKNGFIQNLEQTQATLGCSYYFEDQDFRLSLFQRGFSYQLFSTEKNIFLAQDHPFIADKEYGIYITSVNIHLKGSNPNAKIIAREKSPDHLWFYRNNHSQKVHHFKEVIYKEIYPDIDLLFYCTNDKSKIKYDFIVKPGGNPKDIQLEITGANDIQLNDFGALVLFTSNGEVREAQPFSYHLNDTLKSPVQSKFQINNNIVSFDIGPYDQLQSLIIDPTVFWATYHGHSGTDAFFDVTLDQFEDIITAGSTTSINSISTDTSQYDSSAIENGCIIKFSKNGTKQWGTYLGGGQTVITTVIADHNSNIIVGGYTQDVSTFGGQYGGGPKDGFIAKLNSDGMPLWSRYLGGESIDHVEGVAVDQSDNIYITGWTQSNGFPVTNGSAFGGTRNAFLVKIQPTNGALLWASFFGKYSTEAFGIAVNAMGNPIITGSTTDSVNIATQGGYDIIKDKTLILKNSILVLNSDAFIAEFDNLGNQVMGTYYGGENDDTGIDICIGQDQSINIIGETYSNDSIASEFIDSSTPPQTSISDSISAFVVKFDSIGHNREWGTYYGDGSSGYGITTDQWDNVIITGRTRGGNNIFINGTNVYQISHEGTVETYDGFFAKIGKNGKNIFGSYLGGTNRDIARSVIADSIGNFIIVGETASPTIFQSPPANFQVPIYHDSIIGDDNIGNTNLDGFIFYYHEDDTADINFTLNEFSYCSGDSLFVKFNAIGNYTNNDSFILELSDSLGNFNTPNMVVLDTVKASNRGEITVPIPLTHTPGINYKVRMKVLSPTFGNKQNEQVIIIKNQFIDIDYDLFLNRFCPQDSINFSFRISDNLGTEDTLLVQIFDSTNLSQSLINIDTIPGSSLVEMDSGQVKSLIPPNLNPEKGYLLKFSILSDTYCLIDSTREIIIKTPSMPIRDSLPKDAFCPGDQFEIPFRLQQGNFDFGDLVVALLSDENGSFIKSYTLGNTLADSNANIQANIPDSIPAGENYLFHLEVISDNYCYSINNKPIRIKDNSIQIEYDLPLSPYPEPSFCQGESFQIPFSLSDSTIISSDDLIIAELSDPQGLFIQPMEIGNAAATEGIISCKIPESLPFGDKYQVRLRLISPSYCNQANEKNITIREKSVDIQYILSSDSYCPGDKISLIFNANGPFSITDSFLFQLSDNAGSFTNPLNLASPIMARGSGKIHLFLPEILPPDSNYQIRVWLQSPTLCSENNEANITIRDPFTCKNGIRVFPNPSTTGNFTVELDLKSSSPVHISIVDELGRLVWRKDFGNLESGLNSLDVFLGNPPSNHLENQAPGRYFMQILVDKQSFYPQKYSDNRLNGNRLFSPFFLKLIILH